MKISLNTFTLLSQTKPNPSVLQFISSLNVRRGYSWRRHRYLSTNRLKFNSRNLKIRHTEFVFTVDTPQDSILPTLFTSLHNKAPLNSLTKNLLTFNTFYIPHPFYVSLVRSIFYSKFLWTNLLPLLTLNTFSAYKNIKRRALVPKPSATTSIFNTYFLL